MSRNKIAPMMGFGLSLLVPVLLILVSVRLVMTETYLRLEYQRAGFPEDVYGWEAQTRLEYGPYGIRYLIHNHPIDYLGDLQIDGQRAFTDSELSHMVDVQAVTQWALRGLTLSVILCLILSAALLTKRPTRAVWLWAIRRGGWLTLGLAAALMVVAVAAWDFFFDTFHALFFEAGTWEFHRSDTLIRLYPPRFWFDSALVVGILTLGGALMCVIAPHFALKYLKDRT